MNKDIVEENSYVVGNNGTITLQPGIIDILKERMENNGFQNNHIVYLFINKDSKGIKFYNLDKSNDQMKFITKRKLVFEANWNFLINYPNKSMLFRSDIGDIRIDTYLVSEKEYFRILDIIKKEENLDNFISFKIKKRKM